MSLVAGCAQLPCVTCARATAWNHSLKLRCLNLPLIYVISHLKPIEKKSHVNYVLRRPYSWVNTRKWPIYTCNGPLHMSVFCLLESPAIINRSCNNNVVRNQIPVTGTPSPKFSSEIANPIHFWNSFLGFKFEISLVQSKMSNFKYLRNPLLPFLGFKIYTSKLYGTLIINLPLVL